MSPKTPLNPKNAAPITPKPDLLSPPPAVSTPPTPSTSSTPPSTPAPAKPPEPEKPADARERNHKKALTLYGEQLVLLKSWVAFTKMEPWKRIYARIKQLEAKANLEWRDPKLPTGQLAYDRAAIQLREDVFLGPMTQAIENLNECPTKYPILAQDGRLRAEFDIETGLVSLKEISEPERTAVQKTAIQKEVTDSAAKDEGMTGEPSKTKPDPKVPRTGPDNREFVELVRKAKTPADRKDALRQLQQRISSVLGSRQVSYIFAVKDSPYINAEDLRTLRAAANSPIFDDLVDQAQVCLSIKE